MLLQMCFGTPFQHFWHEQSNSKNGANAQFSILSCIKQSDQLTSEIHTDANVADEVPFDNCHHVPCVSAHRSLIHNLVINSGDMAQHNRSRYHEHCDNSECVEKIRPLRGRFLGIMLSCYILCQMLGVSYHHTTMNIIMSIIADAPRATLPYDENSIHIQFSHDLYFPSKHSSSRLGMVHSKQILQLSSMHWSKPQEFRQTDLGCIQKHWGQHVVNTDLRIDQLGIPQNPKFSMGTFAEPSGIITLPCLELVQHRYDQGLPVVCSQYETCDLFTFPQIMQRIKHNEGFKKHHSKIDFHEASNVMFHDSARFGFNTNTCILHDLNDIHHQMLFRQLQQLNPMGYIIINLISLIWSLVDSAWRVVGASILWIFRVFCKIQTRKVVILQHSRVVKGRRVWTGRRNTFSNNLVLCFVTITTVSYHDKCLNPFREIQPHQTTFRIAVSFPSCAATNCRQQKHKIGYAYSEGRNNYQYTKSVVLRLICDLFRLTAYRGVRG